MKQILIQKNPQIKQLDGSRIEFYREASNDEMWTKIDDQEVTKVTIPFRAKILSGGTLDLDFSLPEGLASKGISLLGAYWNGESVTAYLRAMRDLPQNVLFTEPVLVGTLVQVTTMKQIEAGLLGGVVNIDKSGNALSVEKTPEKKSRRRKKQ